MRRPHPVTWGAPIALILSLLVPWPLLGQIAGGGGVLLQRYAFDDPAVAGLKDFQLVTSPFSASIPVTGFLNVQVSGAYAQGEATGPEGAKATLAGFTDTEIGIALRLGQDRMVLTGGAALPTGQTTLSLAEATVAGIVAAELLPFAISGWGSGGGAGGDVALAFKGGRWGLGLAGGYRASSEFEPLEGETFAYQPGNQTRFRLALDRDVGESGTFSLLLGVQQFSEDQVTGNNLFRSGKRYEGILSYSFALGFRASAQLYGGIFHRSEGALLLEESALQGATASPAQQLFLGGTTLRVPAGRRTVLLPEMDIRLFRTDDGVGQGWVTTAGLSMEFRLAGGYLGNRLLAIPSGRYRFGHVVVGEGSESDLTGFEAGLIIGVEVGR